MIKIYPMNHNFLLKLLEEKILTEEDFKQLQNKYFSKFDK